jgi:hypothetical protein
MATKQAKQQGKDYSQLLIWAAALVGIVRYSAAFLASDMGEITGGLSTLISILLGLSGLGMGFLDTVGGAYLFDGWRRAMPKNGQAWPFRFKVLTVFVFAIFATGIGILAPFTVSRVAHHTMASTLGDIGLWLWSLAVNLAPILLIGGVSVGQHVVSVTFQEQAESYRKVTDDEEKVTGNFPSDWRKARVFMSIDEVREIAQMPTSTIMKKYHLKNEKTARNWRGYAIAEVQKIPAQAGE